MTLRFLSTKTSTLAYHHHIANTPGVVFLGGFQSDMTGTKAIALEAYAKKRALSYLRFDYNGHGQSDGQFTNGTIGLWYQNAMDIITQCTTGAQILVGSSMGGWLALLIARHYPERVAALVGIAAAPDFTEALMWQGFSNAQKQQLMAKGYIDIESDYEAPYTITRALIEDGRKYLLFNAPLDLGTTPVRLLQGDADTDVPMAHAVRLFHHIEGDNVHLSLIKGADHRFSTAACLSIIEHTIDNVVADIAKDHSNV